MRTARLLSVVLAFVMLVPAGAGASPPVDQYVEDIPTTGGDEPVGSPEASPAEPTDAGSGGEPAAPAPAGATGDGRGEAPPDRIERAKKEPAEKDVKPRPMRGGGSEGVPLALIGAGDEGPGFLAALGNAFGLGGATLAALAMAALIGAGVTARRGGPRDGGPE